MGKEASNVMATYERPVRRDSGAHTVRKHEGGEEIGFGLRTENRTGEARPRNVREQGRAYHSKRRNKQRRMILSIIVAGICLVLPILIRVILGGPVRVNGEGMSTAMESGNVILLNKTAYWTKDVERFDIVLCRVEGRDVFRRVIGLPGETVEIREGIVYVNGRTIRESADTVLAIENVPLLRVGNDEYYVLGDNRPIAVDSRIGGPVPKRGIVGKATKFLAPLKKLGQSVDE